MKKRNVKIKKPYNDPHFSELKPDEQTVKNLSEKKIKPSVFIGSSTESHHIARRVQELFDGDRLEVDTWKMDIFGQKDEDGERLSNAEQLKNFTDIYDYAIFLFTPDDQLVSQTREFTDTEGKVESKAVRHNVVFEFGLFLGRIGADRTFILYDQGIKSFIDYFFTDLQEDLTDEAKSKFSMKSDFKIESHSFKGKFDDYLKSGDKSYSYDEDDLSAKVKHIEEKILADTTKVHVGYLPSTSLAKGYFKNFLKRVVEGIASNHGKEIELDGDESGSDKSGGILKMKAMLKKKKVVHVKVVIPDNLAMAKYEKFTDILDLPFFSEGYIPCSHGRSKSIHYKRICEDDSCDELLIYDIPSTLSSSIAAIKMTTSHQDIRQLLSEKERRNFRMVMDQMIEEAKTEKNLKDIEKYLSVIEWKEFRKETGLNI